MNRLMLLGLTLCIAAAGCINFPGSTRWPYGVSADKHNFVSTHSMPLNIEIQDAVTDEVLKRIHIPAGKMLVLDFDHERKGTAGQTTAMPAESVAWEILDPDTTFRPGLAHEDELPGHDIRIKVVKRDDWRLPEGVDPETGLMVEAETDAAMDESMSEAPAEPEAAEAPTDEADSAPEPEANADRGTEAGEDDGAAEPMVAPSESGSDDDASDRGPATMDQPGGMLAPREVESGSVDEEGEMNHVLDSRPNAPSPPPIRAPQADPEAEADGDAPLEDALD